MRGLLSVALALMASVAWAIDASNRYRSPRNPERKVRSSTRLIVLHTTEAPEKSSVNKLSDRGECHYVVTEDGSVYRIVDRDKEAFHAGRSMWRGAEDVDKFSIGIECVGYHDKAMPTVQLKSISTLVKELQSMYRLTDDKVVCHAQVAYGAPNKWHRFKHRGRKRCGMLFAMPSVRRQLGLKTRVACDPDVSAGRLRNADEELRQVLYGKKDTMKSVYAKGPVEVEPEETGIFSWLHFGSKTKEDGEKKSAAKAKPAAKAKQASKPTAKTADGPPRSIAELKRRGYVMVGQVTKGVTASKLVGGKWNAPDTYYTIRNKVISGAAIDQSRIEMGMGIWRKK